MLRITERTGPGDACTLQVEGRISGPWVAELLRVAEARSSPGPLCLDLSGVTYADTHGAAALRRLLAVARLIGCSSFVAALLEGGER